MLRIGHLRFHRILLAMLLLFIAVSAGAFDETANDQSLTCFLLLFYLAKKYH